MTTLMINSAKRSFTSAGLYLAAIAAGIAMSKAVRSGKSNADIQKKIGAMIDLK